MVHSCCALCLICLRPFRTNLCDTQVFVARMSRKAKFMTEKTLRILLDIPPDGGSDLEEDNVANNDSNYKSDAESVNTENVFMISILLPYGQGFQKMHSFTW